MKFSWKINRGSFRTLNNLFTRLRSGNFFFFRLVQWFSLPIGILLQSAVHSRSTFSANEWRGQALSPGTSNRERRRYRPQTTRERVREGGRDMRPQTDQTETEDVTVERRPKPHLRQWPFWILSTVTDGKSTPTTVEWIVLTNSYG